MLNENSDGVIRQVQLEDKGNPDPGAVHLYDVNDSRINFDAAGADIGKVLWVTEDNELGFQEPPVGPKGDPGEPGVYIGTTEPTDPNIRVWIDSDGQPDSLPVNLNSDTNISGLIKGENRKITNAIAGVDYASIDPETHKIPLGEIPDVLPDVTSGDEGKVLVVNSQGEWDKGSNGLKMEGASSVYKVYQDGADVTDNLPYVSKDSVGAANGVATLDGNSKVPVAQMPYQYSNIDLEEDVSPLATGTLYFVYEQE